MTKQNIVNPTENNAGSSEIKGSFPNNKYEDVLNILKDEKLTNNIKESEEINKIVDYLYDQAIKGYVDAAETIRQIACEYDNANAMEKYGRLLESGRGGAKKDVQAALGYYFAAAMYDNRNALDRIVALSKRGNKEAYKRLNELAKNDIPEAIDALLALS